MKALLRFHFRERETGQGDEGSAPAHTDVEVTEGTPVWMGEIMQQGQVLLSVELLLEKEP
jgi:hypothetical protein